MATPTTKLREKSQTVANMAKQIAKAHKERAIRINKQKVHLRCVTKGVAI